MRGRYCSSIATEVTTTPTRQSIAALLAEARERTLALIGPLGDELLNRVYSPLLSPLAWDLGHIANFEELWLVQTVGGRPPLHGELGPSTTRSRTRAASAASCRSCATPSCAPTWPRSASGRSRSWRESTSAPTPRTRLLREGFVYEMLVAHELQHQETMLQLLQMLDVPYRPAEADPEPFAPATRGGATAELSGSPAGAHEVGAPDRGFAYDNERPRHEVELPAFEIDRTPVTNAAYMAYMGETGAASHRCTGSATATAGCAPRWA